MDPPSKNPMASAPPGDAAPKADQPKKSPIHPDPSAVDDASMDNAGQASDNVESSLRKLPGKAKNARSRPSVTATAASKRIAERAKTPIGFSVREARVKVGSRPSALKKLAANTSKKISVDIGNLSGPLKVNTFSTIVRETGGAFMLKERIEITGANYVNEVDKARKAPVKLESEEHTKMDNGNTVSVSLGNSIIVFERSTRLRSRSFVSTADPGKPICESLLYSSDRQSVMSRMQGVVPELSKSVRKAASESSPVYGLEGPLVIRVTREIIEGNRGAFSANETIEIRAAGSQEQPKQPMVLGNREMKMVPKEPSAQNPLAAEETISFGTNVCRIVRTVKVTAIKESARQIGISAKPYSVNVKRAYAADRSAKTETSSSERSSLTESSSSADSTRASTHQRSDGSSLTVSMSSPGSRASSASPARSDRRPVDGTSPGSVKELMQKFSQLDIAPKTSSTGSNVSLSDSKTPPPNAGKSKTANTLGDLHAARKSRAEKMKSSVDKDNSSQRSKSSHKKSKSSHKKSKSDISKSSKKKKKVSIKEPKATLLPLSLRQKISERNGTSVSSVKETPKKASAKRISGAKLEAKTPDSEEQSRRGKKEDSRLDDASKLESEKKLEAKTPAEQWAHVTPTKGPRIVVRRNASVDSQPEAKHSTSALGTPPLQVSTAKESSLLTPPGATPASNMPMKSPVCNIKQQSPYSTITARSLSPLSHLSTGFPAGMSPSLHSSGYPTARSPSEPSSTGDRRGSIITPGVRSPYSPKPTGDGADEITVVCNTGNHNEKIRLRLKVDCLIQASGTDSKAKPSVYQLSMNDVTLFKK